MARSDKMNFAGPNGPQPADLAFLAMTQHQFGQPSPARATLARLRKLVTNPRWANDADAQGLPARGRGVDRRECGQAEVVDRTHGIIESDYRDLQWLP